VTEQNKINRIKEQYPAIFKDCWQLDIDGGWDDLLRDFCERLAPLMADSQPEQKPTVQQIREKYGTMQISMLYMTNEIYELVDDIEERSRTICCECGKPGQNRCDLSWWAVLCDDHYRDALEKQPKAAVLPFRPIVET